MGTTAPVVQWTEPVTTDHEIGVRIVSGVQIINMKNDPLAQMQEHMPSKHVVVGWNPTRVTKPLRYGTIHGTN